MTPPRPPRPRRLPACRAILAWVLVLAQAHAAVAAPVLRGVCRAKGCGTECGCAAASGSPCCPADPPPAPEPSCCAKAAACCEAEPEPAPHSCCAKAHAPPPDTPGPAWKACHCKKPVVMVSPYAEPAVRPEAGTHRFPPPAAGRPAEFAPSAPIPSDDPPVPPPRLP